MYIYIYIYLLIYYLPAFTATKKKKKKTCQNSEITITRITAWGKKKKFIGRKKKKRPTSSHQLKKIETTGVACSDSATHNRVLSIPVYYSPVVRIEPADDSLP